MPVLIIQLTVVNLIWYMNTLVKILQLEKICSQHGVNQKTGE